MNGFIVNIICSHSIVIPAILILIRWRNVTPVYYPFAILLWLGLANESISLAMILLHQGNMGNSNLYILFEYFLLLWQFQRWNNWKKDSVMVLGAIGLFIWVLEHIYFYSLTTNTSIFRLVYSSIIVLLAMHQLTKVVVSEYKQLHRNPVFIISLSFLLYYTFKTYYESFNLLDTEISEHFFYWHWMILNVINLFTNILYTYAIIWIKKKKSYSLQH